MLRMRRAVEREWTQETWRGSPDELGSLISDCAALVGQISGDDSEVTVSVGKGGDDLRLTGISEVSEFVRSGDPRLREAQRVHVMMGGLRTVHLALWFRRSFVPGMYALAVTISGSDPVAVDGLVAETKRLAGRNGRRVPLNPIGWVLWAVGLMLMAPSWFSDSRVSDWLASAGLATSAIAAYILWVHLLVVPRFEIIDPRAPESGSARVRRWLAGSGQWLLAAVVGAVIYALIEKLING